MYYKEGSAVFSSIQTSLTNITFYVNGIAQVFCSSEVDSLSSFIVVG